MSKKLQEISSTAGEYFALHLKQVSHWMEIPQAWGSSGASADEVNTAVWQQLQVPDIFDVSSLVDPLGPGAGHFEKLEKRLHAGWDEQPNPTNKHTQSSLNSLPRPPPDPPLLSICQGRDRIQRNLCLSCTGREQTNRGLLWPLISRSYAAPVWLQRPD